MATNANAPAADRGAAVIWSGKTITAENSATTTTVNGQATRRLLLEQVVRRHRVLTASERRSLERHARLRDAQRLLVLIPPRNRWVAASIGVTSRSILNWRTASHAPQPRHWRRLQALAVLCTEARNGVTYHHQQSK